MSLETFREKFQKDCTVNGHLYQWKKDPDIQLEVLCNGRVILLGWINNRNPGAPGKKGSRALDWICSLADQHGVIIELTVCPPHYFDSEWVNTQYLNIIQLRAWYRRRGFTGTDFCMKRLPQLKSSCVA
jgi:hypothetical protein